MVVALSLGAALVNPSIADQGKSEPQKASSGDTVVTGQHRGFTNDELYLRLDDGKEIKLIVAIPGDKDSKWQDAYQMNSRITVTYHKNGDGKLVATEIKKAGADKEAPANASTQTSTLVTKLQNAPDACILLTAADLLKVAGGEFSVGSTNATKGGGNYLCGYVKGPASPDAKRSSVTITVLPAKEDSGKDLKRGWDALRGQGKDLKAAAGVGPGAFYLTTTDFDDLATEMYFGKGSWIVDLQVSLGGKADADATLKLAAIALGRLP
jgi:hypothetical protein